MSVGKVRAEVDRLLAEKVYISEGDVYDLTRLGPDTSMGVYVDSDEIDEVLRLYKHPTKFGNEATLGAKVAVRQFAERHRGYVSPNSAFASVVNKGSKAGEFVFSLGNRIDNVVVRAIGAIVGTLFGIPAGCLAWLFVGINKLIRLGLKD